MYHFALQKTRAPGTSEMLSPLLPRVVDKISKAVLRVHGPEALGVGIDPRQAKQFPAGTNL